MTSDIWADKGHEDYLSIVIHYLDSKWTLQKRIIGFKLVDTIHAANAICERALSIVEEYSIRKPHYFYHFR